MIAEIRSYFKTVLSEVDSDLKPHNQYFTSENISDTKLEDTYFLQIGAMTTTRLDSNMVGSFDVLIRVWKNGNNNIIERLDDFYCKAIEVQAKAMNQNRVNQTDFMKNVIGNSISPVASLDNDNLAQFDLQFTVTTSFNAI